MKKTKAQKEFDEHEEKIIEQLEKEEAQYEKGEDRELLFEDRNPSVLFLGYGNWETYSLFFKELEKRNIMYRILLPIDINFPVFPNKKYNEQINFFKGFTTTHSKRLLDGVNSNLIVKGMVNNFLSKAEYKLMTPEEFQHDTTNNFLSLSLTPIACQYQQHYKDILKDPRHKQNYDDIQKFHSEGYKPVIDKLFGDTKPEIDDRTDPKGRRTII